MWASGGSVERAALGARFRPSAGIARSSLYDQSQAITARLVPGSAIPEMRIASRGLAERCCPARIRPVKLDAQTALEGQRAGGIMF